MWPVVWITVLLESGQEYIPLPCPRFGFERMGCCFFFFLSIIAKKIWTWTYQNGEKTVTHKKQEESRSLIVPGKCKEPEQRHRTVYTVHFSPLQQHAGNEYAANGAEVFLFCKAVAAL